MKPSYRVDSIVILLTSLIIFLVFILLWVAVQLKSDGQTFQIISNLITGFSGALLTYINLKPNLNLPADSSVKKTVDTHVETSSPKDA